MSTTKLRIGDTVSVREPTEARYSGYGGNPVCIIQPHQIGIVAAIGVPCVRRRKGDPATFVCVDFVVPGVFMGDPRHGNNTWRIGIFESGLTAAAAAAHYS